MDIEKILKHDLKKKNNNETSVFLQWLRLLNDFNWVLSNVCQKFKYSRGIDEIYSMMLCFISWYQRVQLFKLRNAQKFCIFVVFRIWSYFFGENFEFVTLTWLPIITVCKHFFPFNWLSLPYKQMILLTVVLVNYYIVLVGRIKAQLVAYWLVQLVPLMPVFVKHLVQTFYFWCWPTSIIAVQGDISPQTPSIRSKSFVSALILIHNCNVAFRYQLLPLDLIYQVLSI